MPFAGSMPDDTSLRDKTPKMPFSVGKPLRDGASFRAPAQGADGQNKRSKRFRSPTLLDVSETDANS